MFTFSEKLVAALESAGMIRGRAEQIADEFAAQNPEVAGLEQAIREKIAAELEPSLNFATVNGLLNDAWAELRSGHPGYNKHHFGGA